MNEIKQARIISIDRARLAAKFLSGALTTLFALEKDGVESADGSQRAATNEELEVVRGLARKDLRILVESLDDAMALPVAPTSGDRRTRGSG